MKTIQQQLKEYTKKEILSIARFHHMKGYSSMNKSDLALSLANHLASASCLFSDSDYLKQKGCIDGSPFPDDYPLDFNVNNELLNYHSIYKKLNDLLITMGTLNGITPLSIIRDLLQRNEDIILSEDEILMSISLFPEEMCPVTVSDSLCILRDLIPNDLYKKIAQCQGKIPYYLPDHETVKHFIESGYFKDEYTEKLLDYFTEELSMNPIISAKHISGIQAVFRQGGTLMEVNRYLHEKQLLKNAEADKVLLSLLNSMFSHTRLLLNRGYSESEKTAMLYPHRFSKNTNQTLNNPQTHTKIYPNSPCPCGSGKKYKKCCGKR